jgi:hypothetical protein
MTIKNEVFIMTSKKQVASSQKLGYITVRIV